MASTNNPAGRLYDYLSEFRHSASRLGNASPSAVWADVLDAPEHSGEFCRRLAAVAGLLSDISAAVDVLQEPAQTELVDHESPRWAQAFFPDKSAFGVFTNNARAQNLVPPDSLRALNSISSFLSNVAPEGRDIPDTERASLAEQINNVIEEVRNSEDLDPALRALILSRLHDILKAIDNYSITGPKGLFAACQLLAADIVVDDKEKGDRYPKSVRKALTAVLMALQLTSATMVAIEHTAITYQALTSQSDVSTSPMQH